MNGSGTGGPGGAGGAGWRGLQATTLAHRVVRLLRGAGSTPAAHPLAGPAAMVGASGTGAGTGSDTSAGTGTGTGLGSGARAVTGGGAGGRPGDDLTVVLDRARAAGAPPAAVAALAGVWPELDERERREVARPLGDGRPGPLRIAGVPARQTDPTTCGSAVLGLLAATGDPVLALWLATGRLVAGHLPPELRAMPAARVTSADPAVRFGGLQHAVKRASNRGALGPLPWPAALGTPPWGAARAARFGGTRWTHVLVDDSDAALVDRVLRRADAALAAGVPVPLFTGGDLGGGLAAAVPRHVVLLVPDARTGDGDAYAVYEPGAARVVRLTRAGLARPGGPHPALGGWSHVDWAVLPR